MVDIKQKCNKKRKISPNISSSITKITPEPTSYIGDGNRSTIIEKNRSGLNLILPRSVCELEQTKKRYSANEIGEIHIEHIKSEEMKNPINIQKNFNFYANK
mmetsp:Transcript_5875/g.5034  ORF Transcript_5875/g.5034 Transcript_5875/m.5034 type:complete len:102 (+) Transcript_5875:422-727(+)